MLINIMISFRIKLRMKIQVLAKVGYSGNCVSNREGGGTTVRPPGTDRRCQYPRHSLFLIPHSSDNTNFGTCAN